MTKTVRRGCPCLLAGLLLLPGAATPAGAQETDAAGADRVHEVRRGDTLWDLASRYLADPFQWPRIFELNARIVEDPHWIFPGERLRLPGAAAADAAPRPPREAGRPGDRPAVRRRAGRPAPAAVDAAGGRYPDGSIFRQRSRDVPAFPDLTVQGPERPAPFSSSDFYGAPILVPPESQTVLATTERVLEANPLDLALPPAVRMNDRVVVALGGLAAVEDDVLQAVRWDRGVPGHGRVLQPLALLRVTHAAGDTARARVVQLFGDYAVGDPLVPAPEFVPPSPAAFEPAATSLTGRLVAFAVPQPLLGLGDGVFLDLGASEDVRGGDEFAVFGRGVGDLAEAPLEDRLAVVRVIRVTDRTATARVVEVLDPGTRPGDPVRLLRRLPVQND